MHLCLAEREGYGNVTLGHMLTLMLETVDSTFVKHSLVVQYQKKKGLPRAHGA